MSPPTSSLLQEIWAGELPDSTTLVAGLSGVGSVITGVSTLRGRQPGFAVLKGGELALISTRVLQQVDRRLTLSQALERLSEVGVAAVAVQGEIEPEAVLVADRRGLPLLALPPEANLVEIEQRVADLLAEHRAGLHGQVHELASQLQEVLLEGRGATDVADRLASLVACAVAFEQSGGAVHLASPRGFAIDRSELDLALEAARPLVLAWATQQRFSPSDPPVARFELPGPRLVRFVAPVAILEGIVGQLSIIAPAPRLGEVERLATARGAAACALALAHERALQATADRLQRDLMDELLGDGMLDVAALSGRAQRLGYDLELPHLALSLRLDSPNERSNGHNPGDGPRRAAEPLVDGPIRAAELMADEAGITLDSALLRFEDGGLTVLVPLPAEASQELARKTAGRLQAALAPKLSPLRVSMGASGPASGTLRLRTACQEAARAVWLGAQLFGAGQLTHFEELGAYRVLFRLQGTPEVEEFLSEELGLLETYDRQHRAELISTLEVYFASGCSPQETAARLHLHRNTVLYRLQRIADLSGHRLDDPSTRFDLQLALRLRRTLQTVETPVGNVLAAPRAVR